MDYLFDPNNEEERLRQQIEEYYNEFSDNARKRLFAKNIEKPTSVYDLTYAQIREDLLSKNSPGLNVTDDLDDVSKEIRKAVISKNITSESDLLKASEDYRKQLQSRFNLVDAESDLLKLSDQVRKDGLAKNVNIENAGLDEISEQYRRNNLSKNSKDTTFVDDGLIESSENTRDSLKSKNVEKDSDIESSSELYRDSLKAKNVDKDSDLLDDSEVFRKSNVASNYPDISETASDGNLADQSQQFRNDLVAKNGNIDSEELDTFFQSIRETILASNVSNQSSIEDISKTFRDSLISKNPENTEDIDALFDQIRKDVISLNTSRETDLESDSESFRKDNLSSNVITETSLEDLSVSIRNGILSSNAIQNVDFDTLYDEIRNSVISANVSSETDIELDSEVYRKDLLSTNKLETTDLESDSEVFRDQNVSSNVDNSGDLENDSEVFRDQNLSSNSSVETDIESDSEVFRNDNLSLNTNVVTDIEEDSTQFRNDRLSANVSNQSDIEEDSVQFRDDRLSANIPNESDIEEDSVTFRDDRLSANVPNDSDIEEDSVQFREDRLSANVANLSDIEEDSVQFREDRLSTNVSNNSDIETDSEDFRDDRLSKNIPVDSNLLLDSEDFRDENTSSNIPVDSNLFTDSGEFRDLNTSANVGSSSDLLSDSTDFYFQNISANGNVNSNLLIDSEEFRDQNIASNPTQIVQDNLLAQSAQYREDLLSKNGVGQLGVNITAAGTSAFLGVSRVLTTGILFRALLLPRNNFRIRRDEYNQGFDTTTDNKFAKLNDASIVGPLYTTGEFRDIEGIRAEFMVANADSIDFAYNDGGSTHLFGTGLQLNPSAPTPDNKFFGDSVSIYNGVNSPESFALKLGTITEKIRNYNLGRGSYSLNEEVLNRGVVFGAELNSTTIPLRAGSQGELFKDQFQALVQQTIGGFTTIQTSPIDGTLTTPSDKIEQNEGRYLRTDAEKQLANNGIQDEGAIFGSGKVIAGNPFDTEDFRTGERGVKRIVKAIRNSNDVEFASNFDPQNERHYVVGKVDGVIKKNSQRYTIANPYAPQGAKKLHFMFKNYSNNQRLYLPPYISSFQHSSSASWNETQFLGRPEPLYTYNNSKRTGSISFFVLSDYATSVDIGVDFETGERITETFREGFTQTTSSNVLQAEIKKVDKEIAELNTALQASDDPGGKASLEQQKNELQALKVKLREEYNEGRKKEGRRRNGDPNYSEASRYSNNIYTDIINGLPQDPGKNRTVNGGEYEIGPENTFERINQMKQDLQFQPSYFSGDKLDFVKRVEFLEKMCRPSRNTVTVVNGEEPSSSSKTDPNSTGKPSVTVVNSPGFSFINPPVCHLHLGDWFNHDIIVNSVDYSYDNVPWTLDAGGRVQPMWVSVTVSFDIIGRYKHANGDALTSSDRGGFFS